MHHFLVPGLGYDSCLVGGIDPFGSRPLGSRREVSLPRDPQLGAWEPGGGQWAEETLTGLNLFGFCLILKCWFWAQSL